MKIALSSISIGIAFVLVAYWFFDVFWFDMYILFFRSAVGLCFMIVTGFCVLLQILLGVSRKNDALAQKLDNALEAIEILKNQGETTEPVPKEHEDEHEQTL